MSTDVGTWTNRLTFEPDPDYSPDSGTGLLSPISFVLQRGILLLRVNLTYMYWALAAAARRGFTMVLFTASRRNNFVGGTCPLPSAFLYYARMMAAQKETHSSKEMKNTQSTVKPSTSAIYVKQVVPRSKSK